MIYQMSKRHDKTKKKKEKKKDNAGDDEHGSSKHDPKKGTELSYQVDNGSPVDDSIKSTSVTEQEKSGPQTEIDGSPVDRNKRKVSTLTLDEKNSRRLECLRTWMAMMTILLLLFLFASAVGGIFLVGSIKISMDDQQNSISALRNQQAWMMTKDEQTDTGVFFTARTNESLTVTGGQTVVYSHVITSLGGGYNASSGIFSAPKTGYYRAEINTQSPHRQESFLELQHNDKEVFQVKADKSTFIGGKHSASNSAIVCIKKGDQLRVVAKASVNKLTNRYMNTFTVLLVSVE